MTEPTVYLHPQAEAELTETKRMLTKSVDLGIISPDFAVVQYQNAMVKAFSEARREVDGERNIGSSCPACKSVHIMKSDVVEFRCKCSPHTVRFSFQNPVDLV